MLVDEKAEIVRSDMTTAALAPQFLNKHPGSTIVYDLCSSKVVREEIEKAGGTPRRGRRGPAFMKKALSNTKAVFGGELSGRFYFADNWYCDSGMLAFVHVVNLLHERGRPLSEIIKPLKRYAASGERNFENERREETIQELARVYRNADVDFLDGICVRHADWWFSVRKSNTEPLLRLNLEVDDAATLETRVAEVAQYLGKPAAH
jgi:phosphomannomutase